MARFSSPASLGGSLPHLLALRVFFLFCFLPCKAFTCVLRTAFPLCPKHQMSVQVTRGSYAPHPCHTQCCPYHISQQVTVAPLYKSCSAERWVGARCPAATSFSQSLSKSPVRDIVLLLFIKEICLFYFPFFIVVAYLQ